VPNAEFIIARREKEQERIVRQGVIALRKTAAQVKRETIQAFKAKRKPKVRGLIKPVLRPLLLEAMVAANLMGRVNVYKEAPKSIEFAVYTSTVRQMAAELAKRRRELSVPALQEAYRSEALTLSTDISAELAVSLEASVAGLVAKGAHVKEAVAALADKFPKLDLPGRLETIFRTKTRQAYSAGRWASLQDPAIQEILWGFQYSTVGDDRVRPEHAVLDEVVAPKDHPFWDKWWPPNGWNCRCEVIELYDPPEDGKKPVETFAGQPLKPDEGFEGVPTIRDR
jgi:SPP1 gp7 family putative phage head morphogenesis protein